MTKTPPRKLIALSTLLLAAIAAVGFSVLAHSGDDQPSDPNPEASLETAIFEVEGMTCGGCEAGVELAVKKLDGVERVKASYKEGRAEVTYDPAKVTPDDLEAAIEKLGYAAKRLDPPPEDHG